MSTNTAAHHTPRNDIEQLAAYARDWGRDIALIQAQGGNVSFKDEGKLWVKASGVYMADMHASDFCQLQTSDCLQCLTDPAHKPAPQNDKRPSIEALFHAYIPYQYVVHLHAVWAMAPCCLQDPKHHLNDALDGFGEAWALVPYETPGWPLAKAIAETCGTLNHFPKILFLQNHGLIIAGDTLDEVEALLWQLKRKLNKAALPETQAQEKPDIQNIPDGYTVISNTIVNKLAHHPVLQELARSGTFYPDQVVFLGPAIGAYGEADQNAGHLCLYQGQLISQAPLTRSLHEMLQGHILLLEQLVAWNAPIAHLPAAEVEKLQNMEAEKYRQQLAK